MRRSDKGWMNAYWFGDPFNRAVGRGQSAGRSEGDLHLRAILSGG